MKTGSGPKTTDEDVTVRMEPPVTTGSTLEIKGKDMHSVGDHHKENKKLDDNPSKTYRKDPKTIAMLVKDGRYMEPYIPEGITDLDG